MFYYIHKVKLKNSNTNIYNPLQIKPFYMESYRDNKSREKQNKNTMWLTSNESKYQEEQTQISCLLVSHCVDLPFESIRAFFHDSKKILSNFCKIFEMHTSGLALWTYTINIVFINQSQKNIYKL